MQVPESLIGTAIGTALLPTLSEQIVRDQKEAFEHTLNHTIRAILAMTIPLATILTLGIHPIIPILGFDETGTQLVIWTTRAYMFGIVAHSLVEVAARSFYARQDARTPLKLIIITAFIFILLGVFLALVLDLGAPGIALANTLAFSIEAGLLLWLLRRDFPKVLKIRATLWRAFLAAVLGGLVVYFGLQLLPLENWSTIPGILATAATLGTGILVCLPFIWPEVKLLLKL